MNKLEPPAIDDFAALQLLANNPNVGSYPNLQGIVATIHNGYAQYDAVGGNAFSVTQVNISSEEEEYLKAHYRSPPTDLAHITELRATTEHALCPMCGSIHCGTLDHILPQQDYAAFSIFSRNLVPACKCNSKRQDLLIGINAGERILHPYFDDCLSERLVTARFEDLGAVPKVGIRLYVENTHPEYAAIAFHFRSIVERTAITGYLKDRWIKLCREPRLIVRDLKHNPPTINDLQNILIDELNMLDDTHGGKNNWNSVFISGLLENHVLVWLFQQIQLPGRAPNAPLI